MSGGRRGFTLIEVSLSGALLALVCVGFMGLLVHGLGVYQQSIAEETAVRGASQVIDAVLRELKDATASSIVYSATTPDRITFQRMVGYDPLGASDAARRILTPAITFARAPMAAAGLADGTYQVVRSQAGAPTSRVGGSIAASDPTVPALPGFRFDVVRAGATALVTVTVAVSVPGGKLGATVVRRSSSVALEVD